MRLSCQIEMEKWRHGAIGWIVMGSCGLQNQLEIMIPKLKTQNVHGSEV